MSPQCQLSTRKNRWTTRALARGLTVIILCTLFAGDVLLAAQAAPPPSAVSWLSTGFLFVR